MKYIIKMSDRKKDEYIELMVEAGNVFDAISKAAEMIEHPNDTELIECLPKEV